MIDKVIKIYYKYLLKSPIKMVGFKITPVLTDNSYIYFEFKMIKDTSYSKEAMSIQIISHFEKFLKLAGIKYKSEYREFFSRLKMTLDKKVYLNSEYLSKIDEACDNIKKISFHISNNKVEAAVDVSFVDVKDEGDGIIIELTVNILNIKINSVLSTPNEVMNLNSKGFSDIIGQYEYEYAGEVAQIIWDGPETLFNQALMYLSPLITYSYKGNPVWLY